MDIDEHLAQADAVGIAMLVIGPATLAQVLHLPAAEAAELLDRIHVEYSAAQLRYPGRTAFLAALPMQDPDVAIQVLDCAVGELGLRGVSVIAANEGRPLDSEGVIAVVSRIAELGVPLFLHPGLRSSTVGHTHTAREEIGLAWMYQTALAALQLIDGGVLDAVPRLVVVHPHLGGVLPYIAGRIAGVPGGRGKHPLEYYLKNRFYTDAAAATPATLALAMDTYGLNRLLFATDHPFLPMGALRHFIDDNLAPDTAAHIYPNRLPGLRAPIGEEAHT